MTNPGLLNSPSSVCPACNTRLRISPDGKVEMRYACPECRAGLVVQCRSDGTFIVTTVADESPRKKRGLSQFYRQLTGNSRNIAFAVAASIGFTMLSLLTPAVETSPPGPRIDIVAADRQIKPGSKTVADHLPDDRLQKPHSEPKNDDSNEFDDRLRIQDVAVSAPITNRLDASEKTENGVNHPSDGSIDETASALIPGSITDVRKILTEQPVELIIAESATPDSEIPRESPVESQSPETVVSAAEKQSAVGPMTLPQRLGISISSFRLTKPVPLREIIQTVEQMCRVQVDVSAASSQQLAQEVTVSLKDTTPAGILAEAGRKCGLAVIVGDDSVRMAARQN